jgi:hypothetical protein
LPEDIEAQTHVLYRDGQVDGPLLAQDLDLARREQLPHQGVDLCVAPLDGTVLLDLAVLAKHHRVCAGDVDVRNPLPDSRSDDAAEFFHVSPRGSGLSG